MTTTNRVAKVASPDLFEDNGSVLFDKSQAAEFSDPVPPLGAVTFTAAKAGTRLDLGALAGACMNEALSTIGKAFGGEYKTYLLVADGPWRAATSIARRRGLWKNYKCLADSPEVATLSQEIAIETQGQIRFAGMITLIGLSTPHIESARRTESCAFICSKRAHFDCEESIRAVFSYAFPSRQALASPKINWMTLAMGLCPKGDLPIRVCGLFDDLQASVDVFASNTALSALATT